MFNDLDWDDITSSLFGIYFFAQTYVYPGFTTDQLYASIMDLSIIGHLLNVGLVWFMMRYRGQTTKITYVTE